MAASPAAPAVPTCNPIAFLVSNRVYVWILVALVVVLMVASFVVVFFDFGKEEFADEEKGKKPGKYL